MNTVTLYQFLSELKKGERDFFSILKTSENSFKEATFEELLSNTDDVLSGVNRVQINFAELYFQIFDGCLVKHHDNGDIKFVFYTTTTDANKVIEISKILFEELGNGYFDNTRFTSFTNVDKINSLSKFIYDSEMDDIVQVWLLGDLTFLLQYKTDPLCQFSLMITKVMNKVLDASIRRNGSILNLLNLNLSYILSQQELSKEIEYEGDKIKFVDYTYVLDEVQLNTFDAIKVRIFDSEKIFKESIYTRLTLFSSKSIQPAKKIQVIESLIKVYGQDSRKSGELEFYERDIIEQNKFWTGRFWSLNQKHGLYDSNDGNEKFAYDISVDNIDEEEGFRISVSGYNELTSLFGL